MLKKKLKKGKKDKEQQPGVDHDFSQPINDAYFNQERRIPQNVPGEENINERLNINENQNNEIQEGNLNTEEERKMKELEEQRKQEYLKKLQSRLGENQRLITANNAQLDDLLLLAKDGKLSIIESNSKKLQVSDIVFIRGHTERIQLFDYEYNTSRWHPFNFAVYYGHLEVCKFF